MRCYSHLSDDEREQIGLGKALGHSIGGIAQAIGRSKSTISRELSRNRLPSGRYSPLHAAGAYQLRRRREALIERDRALRSFVVDRLAEGWTPEQISGWLNGGNECGLRVVGCETIYAFIYRSAQQAEQLWRYLTRRHKRRRPRQSRPSQDTIKDRVSIHERPKKVDARTEGGHWERDLIICKRTRPVLVLHERKSRVTLAAQLAGKTAAETISVMLAVFARIEPTLRKSITFDNDTAVAQHALLRTMRAMTTWFCDAYASWQKGGAKTPTADYDAFGLSRPIYNRPAVEQKMGFGYWDALWRAMRKGLSHVISIHRIGTCRPIVEKVGWEYNCFTCNFLERASVCRSLRS